MQPLHFSENKGLQPVYLGPISCSNDYLTNTCIISASPATLVVQVKKLVSRAWHHTLIQHTLHYTTLHYTTLHYTTLHYTTLHYTHHTNFRWDHSTCLYTRFQAILVAASFSWHCDTTTNSYGQVRPNGMKAAAMLIFVDYAYKTSHGGYWFSWLAIELEIYGF